MRSRSVALALAVSFAAGAQACLADTSAATVPVDNLFAAFNADSGPRLSESYAPNATIVDEFTPFVWHGPAAGTSFWTSFLALKKTLKISDLHVVHGPLAFLAYSDTKTTAYVVAPTVFTYRVAGKATKETGQYAFVVENVGGHWLIENSAWATTSR